MSVGERGGSAGGTGSGSDGSVGDARSECTVRQKVKEVLERTFDVIRDEVTGDDAVTIRGFGTFQTKQRKAKPARNINTGETILVPARKVVVFKPSKDFNADKL